ncbi:MAG: sigma-54-dependent Fis family transcriptional regulator [Deltaproteobacteria bacterium]|nr:sigma-54-dependent Fis family transcriptional regulator [Deltaproteobacteria bacterium]
MKPRILIVDDEVRMQRIFEINLSPKYEVLTCGDGKEALGIVRGRDIGLMLTDLKMPGMNGVDLLKEVRKDRPDLPVIIMTAYGTVESAVQAMKEGAADYILKPIKMDEMEVLIEKTLAVSRLREENRDLRQELKTIFGPENIIGHHPSMQKVIQLIQQVAGTKTTVLVKGESGTGKELVARAIHYESDRSSKPFVVINCAAIPSTLLESELFGYEKGAFTGATKTKKGRLELADRGTLFLDEIGEMPRELQVKILRVLEEQKFQRVGGTEDIGVDNRIIAATNKDLKQAVEAGAFREDLYYRLNVITIPIPPLRERREDIPLLVEHFLKKHREALKKNVYRASAEVLHLLVDYPWPGNVRELENAIVRALVLCPSDGIEVADLPEEIRFGKKEEEVKIPTDKQELKRIKKQAQQKIKEEIEKKFIEDALTQEKGNVLRAAARVSMDRRQFQNLIKKYGISKKEFENG